MFLFQHECAPAQGSQSDNPTETSGAFASIEVPENDGFAPLCDRRV